MILKDSRLYIGAFDLSADHNEIRLNPERDPVENTAFLDTARGYEAGLAKVTLTHHGWVELGAGKVDDILFAEQVLGDSLVTVSPTGVEGAPSYTFRAVESTYSPGGRIGEMFEFNATAMGKGGFGLVRGRLHKRGAITANGASTPFQHGALLAGDRIIATVHVLAPVTGTNITFTVESDNLVGFGSPTVRGTFPALTIPNTGSLEILGPITDDWWRVAWVVTGGGPSFPSVVTLAKKKA